MLAASMVLLFFGLASLEDLVTILSLMLYLTLGYYDVWILTSPFFQNFWLGIYSFQPSNLPAICFNASMGRTSPGPP